MISSQNICAKLSLRTHCYLLHDECCRSFFSTIKQYDRQKTRQKKIKRVLSYSVFVLFFYYFSRLCFPLLSLSLSPSFFFSHPLVIRSCLQRHCIQLIEVEKVHVRPLFLIFLSCLFLSRRLCRLTCLAR
jgi:hypothetical protein